MAENIKDPTFEEQPEPDGSEPVESIARFETESVSGTDTEKDPYVLEPDPYRMHKDAKAVPLREKRQNVPCRGFTAGDIVHWLFTANIPEFRSPCSQLPFMRCFCLCAPVPDKRTYSGGSYAYLS